MVKAVFNPFTGKLQKISNNLNEIDTRSHLVLSDIGVKTHAELDSHVALVNEHLDWTSLNAGTIHASNYVDNDTTDHTLLSNIGTNSHAAIDTHIAGTGASVHGDSFLLNTGDTCTGNFTVKKSSGTTVFTLQSNDSYSASVSANYSDTSWHGSFFSFYRWRGTSSSPAPVQWGDSLFTFDVWGGDGSGSPARARAGQLLGSVDGNVSAGTVPMKWMFSTQGTVNQMIIKNSGFVGMGTGFTTPSARLHVVENSSSPCTIFNQKSTGDIIDGQDNGVSVFKVADGSKIGFNNATPIVKPAITGSKGGNVALTNLLTQLANYGLVTDSTT